MHDVVDLGLLKMDFLGLRNLDVIDEAVELIGGGLDIDDAPARRPEAVRDARPRRIDGRVPVRVVGDARGAPAGEADRVRGPHRARRALPPGADGLHPDVRRAKARPRASRRSPTHGSRTITGTTYAICIYQEQYMEIAKRARRLHPRRGGDAAQGDRQEDPRADGVAQGQVPRGLRGERRRPRRSRSSSGRTWSRPRTTRSTRRMPPATRSSRTAPPGSRRTTRTSTWPP